MGGFPRVAPSGDLAFTRVIWDTDVFRMTGEPGGLPVVRSTVFDGTPRFSRDGTRLAFCSYRSGAMEVWLSNTDGSEPRQLTQGPGRRQCAPSWSPDGRTIAFESLAADGHSRIWTIDPESGTARPLTAEDADYNAPSWSNDGRWIYFSSNRSGTRHIWRMQVAGGSLERVSHAGSGLTAMESHDGRFVVYQPDTSHLHEPGNAPLLAQPLAGGPARQILPCVRGSAFTVGGRGVYYVSCRDDGIAELQVVDPATGERQPLGRLDGYQNNTPPGLAVAPDEQAILYDRVVNASEDLILLQNFR